MYLYIKSTRMTVLQCKYLVLLQNIYFKSYCTIFALIKSQQAVKNLTKQSIEVQTERRIDEKLG